MRFKCECVCGCQRIWEDVSNTNDLICIWCKGFHHRDDTVKFEEKELPTGFKMVKE